MLKQRTLAARMARGRITVSIIGFLGALGAMTVTGCDSGPKGQQTLSFAEAIHETVADEQASRSIQGLSVAVIEPDEGLVLAASGESEPGIRVSPDMTFAIASITKNYIAALVLTLVDEGLVDLDDPLFTWLPTFQNVDMNATLRQILNHTSGIFNYTESDALRNTLFADPGRSWTREEILTYLGPPDFAPGTSWNYSNTGFILAGMVIEVVTGAQLSVALRSNLLTPLGINETYLVSEESIPGTWAAPWSDFDGDNVPEDISAMPKQSLYSAAWAAGGLAATAGDVAKWISALFEGDYLSEASLNEMLATTPVNRIHIDGYGLGTMLFLPTGSGQWGHTGDITGFGSIAMYSPEEGVTIVVLANQELDETTKLELARSLLQTIRSFE